MLKSEIAYENVTYNLVDKRHNLLLLHNLLCSISFVEVLTI